MPIFACSKTGGRRGTQDAKKLLKKREQITYISGVPAGSATIMETLEPPDLSTSSSATPSRPLTNLPVDIINEIFPYLTPVSSVCLGLTCKAFYEIHKRAYPGRVGLHEVERLTDKEDYWWLGDMIVIRKYPRPEPLKNVTLGQLLTHWIGPEFYLHRIVKCPIHVENLHVIAAGIRSAVFLRREDPNGKGELGLLLQKFGRMFMKEEGRRKLEEKERTQRHLRLIPRTPQPRVPRVVKRNFPRHLRS